MFHVAHEERRTGFGFGQRLLLSNCYFPADAAGHWSVAVAAAAVNCVACAAILRFSPESAAATGISMAAASTLPLMGYPDM